MYKARPCGNDIAEELTKLRDNTPVTPFEEIKEVIETQLGQPKIGKAIIFKKMFEDLMAKKERREADFSILIEHIEVWKEESPDDLNAILASILVKAQDASPDDIKAEYEQAKAEYHAEDEEILPWFESQIENITNEDENAEVDIE